MNSPLGLAVDTSGNLYIADNKNQVIRKVSNGTITTVAEHLSDPTALAVDGDGNLYVVDGWVVRKVSNGVVTEVAEGAIVTADDLVVPRAQLGQPAAVAVDAAGCVYVSDWINNQVLVLDPRRDGPAVRGDGLAVALQPAPSCGTAALQ